MIFLLANTLACVTFAVLVNINDKRKVTHKEVISLAQSYQLGRSWRKHEQHGHRHITYEPNVLHFVSLKD